MEKTNSAQDVNRRSNSSRLGRLFFVLDVEGEYISMDINQNSEN
jgi:hypothetical protein